MLSGNNIKKGSLNSPNVADNTIQKNCISQRYDYIPIDFIKCQVIGLSVDYFKQNMNLTEYESKKENKSKFLFYELDNMKIKIFVESGRIELSGSIHKFFNKGFHNHSKFSCQNYLDALERLKITFGVLPKDLKILQLEYGVNVEPPIKTNQILDNLFLHQTTKPEKNINSCRGYYIQFKHDKYIIKIYDKAKQYKLKKELIRFEIKQTNWSEYRIKYKIETLADLNKFDKKIFIDNLIKKYSEIVFYDPTIKTLKRWDKYSNQNFWIEILKTKQLRKHRTRLNYLIQNHSDNIKGQISILIHEHIKGVQNSELSQKKKCLLTGVDISIQRPDSFLLSHQGLYYLKQQNPILYNRIKKIFLSPNWLTSSEKIQVKEIAHKIRSKYNYIQRTRPNQLYLF